MYLHHPFSQHKHDLSLVFVFVILLTHALLVCIPSKAANVYPPEATLEEVQVVIDQAPKSHPRLFANRTAFDELRKRVEENALMKMLAEAVIHQADLLLDRSPIEYRKTGRRLLGQSRECVRRMLLLGMAYQITGEKKYAERGENEMLAVAAFSDWNPSHFLDVGEMTFALAVGYDWLYHVLSDASRETIRAAIVDKGVILPFTTDHNAWVRSTNNWGQVCHGGLTAGALAVLEDHPDLAARTVHSALHNVTRSMAVYAPKGSYPEGPGYWSYGTTYNTLLIDALESAIGSDFGLNQCPGFEETGAYLSLVTGPSGLTFNYADGRDGRIAEPALLWFASRYQRPDWIYREPTLFRNEAQEMLRRDTPYGSRFFPMALLWMPEKIDSPQINLPLHWSGEGRVPITVHRSAWQDSSAVFVGVKAGSPSAPHGQMDIGSFVLDADGQRWALDLGLEEYGGIESRGMNLWNRRQDSDRWTIFRLMNHSHNTLVIDDQLQIADNHGHILKFSDDASFPHTVVDMSAVYEGQAESVKRGIAFLPNYEVWIRDEITGLESGASVRWGMITSAEPSDAGSETLTLSQSDKTLTLTDLNGDVTPGWSLVDTATPRKEWDSPNIGTVMAALKTYAPADGTLTLNVLITPGSVKTSVADSLVMKTLEEW